MNCSILTSIKKMLGIDEFYDAFDPEIIIHINSAIATLRQIGACGDFSISGSAESWHDLLGEDEETLNSVKTYIYYSVRTGFDPPTSSFVLSSMQDRMRELEWRLNVDADSLGE